MSNSQHSGNKRNARDERDKARRREALRDIERIGETSEVLGTSALRRAANSAVDHFGARDADKDDWAEIWGKRIGRIVSLFAFIALAIYLVVTYL